MFDDQNIKVASTILDYDDSVNFEKPDDYNLNIVRVMNQVNSRNKTSDIYGELIGYQNEPMCDSNMNT